MKNTISIPVIHFAGLLTAVLLVTAACAPLQAGAQTTTPPTDATFVFASDIHVAYNGYDDHQGIENLISHCDAHVILLIGNVVVTSPNQALVLRFPRSICQVATLIDDLCNQIQLVRKLNHLPQNTWPTDSFTPQNGAHSHTFSSAGQPIVPRAVLIGGDLTDCGGGLFDAMAGMGRRHPSLRRTVTSAMATESKAMELTLFKRLFDREDIINSSPNFLRLGNISVIQGLNNPDSDVPLHYPIYPGLGNHDLGFDRSGDMMNYIRQWNTSQPASSMYHVNDNDSDSGDYSIDWGRLHVLNVGVFAGSNNHSGAADDDNYPYSDNTMTWISKNLANYAYDGRPIIIWIQHFALTPHL